VDECKPLPRSLKLDGPDVVEAVGEVHPHPRAATHALPPVAEREVLEAGSLRTSTQTEIRRAALPA